MTFEKNSMNIVSNGVKVVPHDADAQNGSVLFDALRLIDQARAAAHAGGEALRDAANQAEREAIEARHALQAMRLDLEQAQADRDRFRMACGDGEARIAALQAENAGLLSETADLRVHVSGLQSEVSGLRATLGDMRADLRDLQSEAANLENDLRDQHDTNDALNRRNRELQDDLLKLYCDLRAADLPSLILRVAMKLTGAEQGLYTDVSLSQTLAAIDLDSLGDAPQNALREYGGRVAGDGDEAVVCNESDTLPGGYELVNLAAVPVSVQGASHGVIIVANKRNGPFTEADTDLLLSVGKHACTALENSRLHRELGDAYAATVAVLADAIEAKDPYTRGHCETVARIAVIVAEELGLTGETLEQLRYAALLHDVGKIGVSDGILLKPSALLPEERKLIQRHSSIGRDLVNRVPALQPIASMILHHHEYMDGSGYPEGLSGHNIPLGARIIGAADAFDAMTSERPYRHSAATAEEALTELRRCAGVQFDPEVVALIEKAVRGGLPDPAIKSDTDLEPTTKPTAEIGRLVTGGEEDCPS